MLTIMVRQLMLDKVKISVNEYPKILFIILHACATHNATIYSLFDTKWWVMCIALIKMSKVDVYEELSSLRMQDADYIDFL
jgi:hypothetical protein